MTTHDEYRVCRVAVRKTKAHWELKLVRNLRANKKGLNKHVSSKKKIQENVGPTFSRAGK